MLTIPSLINPDLCLHNSSKILLIAFQIHSASTMISAERYQNNRSGQRFSKAPAPHKPQRTPRTKGSQPDTLSFPPPLLPPFPFRRTRTPEQRKHGESLLAKAEMLSKVALIYSDTVRPLSVTRRLKRGVWGSESVEFCGLALAECRFGQPIRTQVARRWLRLCFCALLQPR